MKNNKPAFTLIELLIVVVIIIILAGIGIPLSVSYINERQVYNAATQIQQDILLIQNLAITHSSGGPVSGSKRFVMRLYLANNVFSFQTKENSPDLPTSNPTPGNNIVVRVMPSSIGFPSFFEKTSPESVKIGSNNVTGGYVDLAFDNQGTPYWSVDGGSFQQAEGHIILINSSLSKQIKITISPIGRVTIDWITK